MDIVKRLNKVVDYIEEHISTDIETSELAKIVGMNLLHFQSLFGSVTDMTVTEYIKKRRMSCAAEDLQRGQSVTDVGYKYGYNSPDSFTRAFRRIHGINPSIAKQQNIDLVTYPKLTIQIIIKGVEEMNFKIVDKEAFTMYGMERIITNIEGQNLNEIPLFWQDVMADGSFKKLLESTNIKSTEPGIFAVNGVMCYGQETMEKFPYAIAAFKTPESNTEGFVEIEIPAYKWVVFTTEDYKPDQTVTVVQDLWKRIFTEWLPSSEYEFIDGANMELYGSRDDAYEYCEVWLPIEKI